MVFTVFDIIMARSLRSLAGFVWGSTFILSQKVYYYNYFRYLSFFVVVKFQIFFIKKSKTVGQQNLSRELPPSTTSPTQFP